MSATPISPELVGRRDELSALLGAVERAAQGDGGVAVIAGEAGVGKTRLVEEAGARAEGARVLSGACVELGGDLLPLAPLVEALRSLARSTPAAPLAEILGSARRPLARLVPELDPEAAGEPAAHGAPAQLLDPLLGVLGRIASREPLMLVIEDLHWADRSTLDLIALMARSLRGMRVLLVVTYRSDEVYRAHAMRPLVAGWERDRSVHRIALERFTRAEVERQLRAILGDAPEPALTDIVFERSEGNAFLVEEVAAAVRSGADPRHLAPSLRDVLLARVERLSQPARHVLRAVAAAGRRVPDELLAAVSRLDEPARDAALREAIDHHVLVVDHSGRGYSFRHVLARDAIYDDILPGERVRLHAAYGEALSAHPDVAGADGTLTAQIAHHAYAALDLPLALTASVDAARETAPYAPAEAERHLERALEIWPRVPDAQERCRLDQVEVLRLAAESAFWAHNEERSLSLLDEALAQRGPDPMRHALLLELRARALRESGRTDDCIAALREAAALIPPEPPSVAYATVLDALADALARNGQMAAARAAAEEALAAARAANALRQQASAAATLGAVVAYLGGAEEGLASLRAGRDLALQIEDHPLAVRAQLNLADALELLGRREEAVETASAGLALARRAGLSRSLGGILASNLAESLLHLGRWQDAESVLADWLAERSADSNASVLEVHARLAAFQGRYDDAIRSAGTARAVLGDARDEPQYTQALDFVEAYVAHARGDAAAARSIVARGLSIDAERWMPRYAWPLVSLGLRVEAETAERDEPRAAALARIAAELAAETPQARAHRALADAERRRIAGDAGGWAEAAAAWRAAGEPHPLAYALLRLAEAADDRDAASEAAREAGEIAARLGADPLARDIAALARRARLVTPRERERFGLTDREQQVLALVAEGRSNAQIAQLLFISPKTASVHVSNILGKLGVAGRGEAAALAHRTGLI
ncbi:MAG TPA: AAA family ATPase [Solirubrobacteraceae bacterium]|nr:AAA family ATPase [Solirubrobacteraceae bacterium]